MKDDPFLKMIKVHSTKNREISATIGADDVEYKDHYESRAKVRSRTH